MKNYIKLSCFYAFFIFITIDVLYSSSLNIDNEYRLRGLAYTNLDFNTDTKQDAVAYYTQKMTTIFKGLFPAGKSESSIELCIKFTALDIIGSTSTIIGSTQTSNRFSWMSEYPYPDINFMPFIENAYLKINNVNNNPVDIVIGKQSFEYGSGLILSDNGSGLFGIRALLRYPQPLNTEIFTIKVKENFTNSSDYDINGVIFSGPYKGINIEAGFFNFINNTGSKYILGYNQSDDFIFETTKINRLYYDFRFYGEEKNKSFYDLEIAYGKGKVNIISNESPFINIDSRTYKFSGGLIAEKTKWGKFIAKLNVSVATGDNFLNNDFHDGCFYSDFAKRFDGLERHGYGNILKITTFDALLDRYRENFSGFGIISIGGVACPSYEWKISFDATYYNASQNKLPGLEPKSSSFETNLLGQPYGLGAGLDLSLNYSYSKNINFSLSYSRYTPPSYQFVWPVNRMDELYTFETICRF